MLRRVPDADAFVACVQAAAAVQDRRIDRDGSVIVPARIPAPDAHLCSFERLPHEQLVAKARKGGRISKTPARFPERNADIVRLRGLGVGVPEIAERFGISRPAVWGVLARHDAQRHREAPGRPLRQQSAMQAFGFTLEEFQDYGVIRAKGFSREEAAEIVLRSRRVAPSSAGG